MITYNFAASVTRTGTLALSRLTTQRLRKKVISHMLCVWVWVCVPVKISLTRLLLL